MADPRSGDRLEQAWDAVWRGDSPTSGLDPRLAEALQALHARDRVPPADPAFVADVRKELVASAALLAPPTGRNLTAPNGRSTVTPLPASYQTVTGAAVRRLPARRLPTHLATAALLLLTLVGSFLAFGPGRPGRQPASPTVIPALSGTSAADIGPTTETLLDTNVPALPEGRMRVAVDRWTLQPSPAELVLPADEGVVLMTVDSGEVTVTAGGTERRLQAGDAIDVTNQEFALRAAGSATASAYVVYVTPELSANRLWVSGDPLVHASDLIISSGADQLPGGSAQLLLERLTLPSGSALPPQVARPLTWTEVGSGELGLKLEGERLPFQWQPGTERKYFQFGREILPILAPGTHMMMRNAGDDPLVLYRLTLVPEASAMPSTETLLDTAVPALPEGRAPVAVDRWNLLPSPSQVTLPAIEGVALMTVDAGEVTVTAGGAEHRLEHGDILDVTNQEISFGASGAEKAITYVVYITPELQSEAGQSHSRIWKDGDPLVHAMDFVIGAGAEDLPGGPGRLVLEQLSLLPGTTLPPQEASPLVWTEVGSGVMGLSLEGERLPFRWQPGSERTFRYGDYLPYLVAGTRLTMRNAGETPLVLYRLTLTPDARAAPRATPTADTPGP